MTEISFHSGVADPLDYVCRLVRKAVRRGSKVTVSAELPTLSRLDAALWSFDPLDFVAHALLREGRPVPPRLSPTPVWLTPPGVASPAHEVLVNLGPELAIGFETYPRLIEIVAADEPAAQAGRMRWKHYKERGYAIEHHQAGAAG